MPHLPQNESHNNALIKRANLLPTRKLNGKSIITLNLPPINPIIDPLRSLSHPINHKPQRKATKTPKTSQTLSLDHNLARTTTNLEEMPHVITDNIRKSGETDRSIALLNKELHRIRNSCEGTGKEI